MRDGRNIAPWLVLAGALLLLALGGAAAWLVTRGSSPTDGATALATSPLGPSPPPTSRTEPAAATDAAPGSTSSGKAPKQIQGVAQPRSRAADQALAAQGRKTAVTYRGRTGLFGVVESWSCAQRNKGKASEVSRCALAHAALVVTAVDAKGAVKSSQTLRASRDGSFAFPLKAGLYVVRAAWDHDPARFGFVRVQPRHLTGAWVYSFGR